MHLIMSRLPLFSREELFLNALKFVFSQGRSFCVHLSTIRTWQIFWLSMLVIHMLNAVVPMFGGVSTKFARVDGKISTRHVVKGWVGCHII